MNDGPFCFFIEDLDRKDHVKELDSLSKKNRKTEMRSNDDTN